MSIQVADPVGAATDPALPTLPLALDPGRVERLLVRRVPSLLDGGFLRLRTIRVIRHKPGKRCLVEYKIEVERPDAPRKHIALIGKVGSCRSLSGHRLLKKLWNAGFDAESEDGVSVAEPIGVIPELGMWLQRKVPGRVATDLLGEAEGKALAGRIAETAHKLHGAGVPAKRTHRMADELAILHRVLPSVATGKPRFARRIERLLRACDGLGAAIPAPALRGIHRNFYADQVIADNGRLYLVDFDLYSEGDPALDLGNFLGHVVEQSLRRHGDPAALAPVERAMEERFVELSGEAVRPAIHAYSTLTLARHVYLSTQFPERYPFTPTLLELCEERLDLAPRGSR